MDAIFSRPRVLAATASVVVGLAVCLWMQTPFGLLAPTVALLLFASRRTGWAFSTLAAVGVIGSLLAAGLVEPARGLATDWAATFALAACIGALIAARTEPAAASPQATRKPAPSYPTVGPTLEEKAAPRHSPRVAISAQDDAASAPVLEAVSFWGGLPFHVRYWRRLPDGGHLWVESRSQATREAGGARGWRASTAELGDPGPGTSPPTQLAFNPPSKDEAVRAAKLVEALLGNSWAFDAAGRPTYLSPFAQTFVAATLEEFQAVVDQGHTFFKLTAHPDDYERISDEWRRSLRTGKPFFLDRRIRRASGIHEWNRTGFVPTRDRQGRVTGWYGSTIDLDSHRITQAELRDRERELSQLVDMVPSFIGRLTPDGEPVFFNKRMIDYLGLDVADLERPGMTRRAATVATAIHPDDAAGFAEALDGALTRGEPFLRRYRLRRADGVYRWVEGRFEPLRDQNAAIVQWYGASVDIHDEVIAQAELRRTQERLAQAGQAASLAELSASIAHEVNQPLAAVVANSNACQRWLAADPPNLERAKAAVARIVRDANSAADVVRRIRALFKQDVAAQSGSSLAAVIADATRWVSDLATHHGVRLASHVEPDVPLVAIDQVQVQQVLINLMRNAVEAMAADAGERTLSVRASRDGDVVRIEVRDSGPGLEDAERLFDAFFTTKASGMGMGLAISRSIVESHGGRLWAEANAGRGAVFIFTLPIEAPSEAS